ncbi:hypothetical protein OU798_19805 [Prolixibacteraceae bacterium Z1-6]|uniref:Photosynthesis system II assembly factor Ycf48/Hcf136-like domain-containing protein n=1 Tax=Draconibacterium aestuarii TaxID=2998507 RepID=A0A9X3F917_9BACT|nr:hypothetical protein [Prolixibacteraceae bacterium Z1-6]
MKTYKITLAILISLFALSSCELIDDIFTDDSGIDVKTYSCDIPNVRDIFFINKSIGYAVGGEGMIKKTTDGGQTWDPQESGTTLSLTTVFFIDENIGYATGAYSPKCTGEDCNKSGLILRTTNGGKKWEKEFKPEIAFFYDLYFVDENNGIGILLPLDFNSDSRYAVTTEDAGKTWNYLNLEIQDNIGFSNNHSIERIFVKNNVCYIWGDERKIYKSTDLFKTWETIHTPIKIRNASFVNSETGFIYGFTPETLNLYKTINGGNSWSKISQSDEPVGFSHFFDESNGISIDYNSEVFTTEEFPLPSYPQAVSSIIYFTKDGGTTWQNEENPEVISGYKSSPTNDIIFYVNDENTYVLKLK